MSEIVIAGATRTPIGSFNGSLSSVPAHYLGQVAITEAMKRANVDEVAHFHEGAAVAQVAEPFVDRGKKPGAFEHDVRAALLRGVLADDPSPLGRVTPPRPPPAAVGVGLAVALLLHAATMIATATAKADAAGSRSDRIISTSQGSGRRSQLSGCSICQPSLTVCLKMPYS